MGRICDYAVVRLHDGAYRLDRVKESSSLTFSPGFSDHLTTVA